MSWVCKFCETTNSDTDGNCVVCDRDRAAAPSGPPTTTQPVTAHAPTGTAGSAGEVAPTPSTSGPLTEPAPATDRKGRTGLIAGIATALLLIIGGTVFALTRSASTVTTSPATTQQRDRSASGTTPSATSAVAGASPNEAAVPVAIITEPADNAPVGPGSVRFVATLTPPAAVSEAALTIDVTRVASGPNATLTWENPTPGAHAAYVTIQLADGRSVRTDTITVNVAEPIELPTTAAPVTTAPAPAPTPSPSPNTGFARSYRAVPGDGDPLYIRDAPRTTGRKLGGIPDQAFAEVYCKTTGERIDDGPYKPTSDWLWVRYGTTVGWVSDFYMVTLSDVTDGTIPWCP